MTLPRPAQPALTFVDEHCQSFRPLFDDVRCFEHFKALHLGLLSKLPRKSLPALACFLGLSHAQGLHHLLTTPHLHTDHLRQLRTDLVRTALGQRPITLLVDETGDRKKGKTTDYTARQYLGSLGKIEQGLVTVHVVALVGHITFPLLFDVFKPERCLKPGEPHRSKIQIATDLLEVVARWQLNVELVVADALYGEAARGAGDRPLRARGRRGAAALPGGLSARLRARQAGARPEPGTQGQGELVVARQTTPEAT